MAMAAFTGMDGAGAVRGAGDVCQASGAVARGGCGNAPGGACSGIIGKFGIGEPPMNGEHPAGGQPPALRAGVRASQQTVPITGMSAQGAALRMRGSSLAAANGGAKRRGVESAAGHCSGVGAASYRPSASVRQRVSAAPMRVQKRNRCDSSKKGQVPASTDFAQVTDESSRNYKFSCDWHCMPPRRTLQTSNSAISSRFANSHADVC